MTIFLDVGILGLLTHKNLSDEVRRCTTWLRSVSDAGHEVVICEINDYELRRSLIKINSRTSILELDALISRYTYSPITTPIMRSAAAFWAVSKQSGRPLAHPQALDCDVILLATVENFSLSNPPAVIATTDVSDLRYFADARLWPDIVP